MSWRILGRHKKWVGNCTISESINEDGTRRRFVATIDGFEGWLIWVGDMSDFPGADAIQKCVRLLYHRILRGDKAVFTERGPFLRGPEVIA